MPFFAKRFIEEFFLYSSQLVVFFIVMLALIPSADALTPLGILILAGFVIVQNALLASQGHNPLLRLLYAFITPIGYSLVRSFTGSFIVTDMANIFLWGAAFYLGLFQAMSTAARAPWIKRLAETLLAVGAIVVFVFLYFYLDLRNQISDALTREQIDLVAFRKALDVRAFPAEFAAFARSPQHLFLMFGAATFAAFLLANRVRVLNLRLRISSLFREPWTTRAAAPPATVGAEEVSVVVISADIRDFTSFAEEVSPEAAVETLNRYYSLWSICADRSSGEVVGATGDSVLIVFGLLGSPKAADEAVVCATDFLASLGGFQDDLQSASLPAIAGVSIGVHAGTLVAGRLGPPGALRVGVFGDAVSVAARLDSLCREYKQNLLISQPVFSQLALDCQERFVTLGDVLMRNGTQPVPVYGFK